MINKHSQKIFNNSILYSAGAVLSKAVSFFLVPIYTYCLSKEDYGISTTITTFVSSFGIVVMLSLRAAMMRFYNGYTESERRRFAGTILSTVSFNAVIACMLLCVFHRWYSPFFFKDVAFFPCVFFGVLSLGAESIYLVYQSLLQARQNAGAYSLNSVIYLLVHSICVILFIAVFKMGALGVVLSNFVTNTCLATYGVMRMLNRKLVDVCFDRAMFKTAILYSLPILPHNLSNDINVYAIKMVVNHYLGYALSGIYALALQFSTIINLVQSSVNLAFRPWFVEQMQCGEEGRRQIKHMSCMIMALLSFCAVCICVFSKEIIFLMAASEYHEAWRLVPIIVMAQLITFIYFSHVQTLMYNTKASKFTFVCSLSGLIVNVGISVWLAKPLGIYGVLVGQIVSKTVLSAIAVVMSNCVEKVDFGLKYMIAVVILASVMAVAGFGISMWDAGRIGLGMMMAKMLIIVAAAAVFLLPYRNDYTALVQGVLKRKKGE